MSIGDHAFNNCSGLTNVEIPSKVVNIGEYAFRGCVGLENITIPNSVLTIRNGAFERCEALTSVIVPPGVENIGDYTFCNCKDLTYVEMPNSITNIGFAAFDGCSGLASVTIPEETISIGNGAFHFCSSLSNVEFLGNAPQIWEYSFANVSASCTITVNYGTSGWDDDGDGMWNGFKIKYIYSDGGPYTEVVDGVEWTFDVENGEAVISFASPAEGDVIIPSELGGRLVTSISGCPFLSSGILMSITIPEGVTRINSSGLYFEGNGPRSLIFKGDAPSVDPSAFENDNSCTITVNYSTTGWDDDGDGMWQGMTLVYTEVVDGVEWTFDVENGEAVITSASPAEGNLAIPSELCGCSVTSIGDYAFQDCSELTSITMPSSVTSIGEHAFANCIGLTGMTIPDGVASIGECAFYGCSGLKSVTIPEVVSDISWGMFYKCSGLTSMTIPPSVTNIGGCAFIDCSGLTSVTIPPSVTSIGYSAFYGCSGLTSVTIPSSVTNVGHNAFSDCDGLTSVTVPGWKCEIDFSNVTNLVISEGTTSIGNGAFWECDGLKSVTIPSSVTNIGDYAFSECSGLTSVTIPECVTRIGNAAFSGCYGLTSVTIPSSVTSIGEYAFYNCSGLTSVTIPARVVNIGEFAFGSCSALTGFVVDEANSKYKSLNGLLLSKDGKELIYGHNGVVTLPECVTSISNGAFGGYSGLTSVTIPSNVISVGDYAFSGCSGLTSVTIPPSVTSIGHSAFCCCSGLTNVTIPSSVTSISGRMFSECTNLTSVTISEGVTSIGVWAFWGCSKLARVTIPSSITSIGRDAFDYCARLGNGVVIQDGCVLTVNGECPESVILPMGTRLIAGCAFYNCSGLTSVTIPEGVTSIGDGAFSWCDGLTSVTIPSSVTNIGGYAFDGCGGLASVTIPSSVTSIGGSAFSGCSGLTSIAFEGNALIIGEDAFDEVPSTCAVIVKYGSTGWDDDGDGYWQGFKLRWIDKPIEYVAEDCDCEYDSNGHTVTVNVTCPISGVNVTFSLTENGEYLPTLISFTNVTDGAQKVYFRVEAEDCVATNGVATVTIRPKTLTDNMIEEIADQVYTGSAITPVLLVEDAAPCKITADDYSVSFKNNVGVGMARVEIKGTGNYCGTIKRTFAIKHKTDDATLTPPEWDPVAKDDTMIVYANVYDCATISYVEEDGSILAAFDKNGECRGTAVIEEGPLGMIYQLSVGVESSYETGFILKVWNSKTGVITELDERINSNADRSIGQIFEPKTFVVKANESSIKLTSGWNWVSTCIMPNDNTISSIFYGIDFVDGDMVKSANSFATYYHSKWYPSSFSMKPGTAYMVKKSTNGNESIRIVGTQMDDGISVKPGWNWIGSTLAIVQPIANISFSGAFKNNDVFKTKNKSATYYNGKWYSNTYQIESGVGYKVNVTSAGVISFDNNLKVGPVPLRLSSLSTQVSNHDWEPVTKEDTLAVYVRVKDGRGKYFEADGTILAAFDSSGVCRGVATIEEGPESRLFQLSIGVENAAESGFTLKLWDPEDDTVIEVPNTIACNDAKQIAQIYEPLTLVFESAEPDVPAITDDPTALIIGDAESGYTITPSKGKTEVVVSIPDGVEPEKVTVVLGADVETVKPNGAKVKIKKGENDITDYLNIPKADVSGIIDLTKAAVKEEIVKETLDPDKGAEIELNSESPSLTTAETKPGLTYTLREGSTLEGMNPGDSKLGDGNPWTPNITVKGGKSGFYSIGVTK